MDIIMFMFVRAADTEVRGAGTHFSRQESTCSTVSTDSDDVFRSQTSSTSSHPTSHSIALHSQTASATNLTGKVYNPFPKPVTGLLSADKAKKGVRLGLYTTKNALHFMSPSQRNQFIASQKKYYPHGGGGASGGRLVTGSKSTFW